MWIHEAVKDDVWNDCHEHIHEILSPGAMRAVDTKLVYLPWYQVVDIIGEDIYHEAGRA